MSRQSIKVLRNCKICSKEFVPRTRPNMKPTHGLFCSRTCAIIFRDGGTLKERFLKLVGDKEPNGCIIWKGTRIGANGHGIIARKLAHRLAYEYAFGSIPDGLYVLHKCDNPPCVNPEHLFAGTQKDNMYDMIAKKRSTTVGVKGEENKTAKLTTENVIEIRRRVDAGELQDVVRKDFGISTVHIWRIVNRLRWTHV